MSKLKILNQFKGGSMAETFLVEKRGVKSVRKIVSQAQPLGIEKLKTQWEWLFEFTKENPGICPDVSFFVTTRESGYYDMEYIELPTLRDLLLVSDDVDLNIFHDVLNYGSLIAEPIKTTYDGGRDYYVKQKHIDKMFARCKDLEPYEFYKMDSIFVNNKELKNLHVILKEIYDDKELMELLKPKQWYRSHGDFTFQNILTNEEELYVIDPRGEGPDSIYYDISKLFQSCHGKYDLLVDGNYHVWSDGMVNTINYAILNGVEKFDNIFTFISELIPQHYDVDEHWELITKFYEASHFISMTPFRLKENGSITAICYAIGIELLNEVMEEWKNVKSRTATTVG